MDAARSREKAAAVPGGPRQGGPTRSPALRNRDDGAALVELALVIVIVVMLIVGALTGGLAYNRKITLTDAARVASRYGTTHAMPASYPTPPQCGDSAQSIGSQVQQWLVDVACDAVLNAQGELDAGTSGRMICVAYVPAGTDLSGATYLEWDQGQNAATFTSQRTCPQVAQMTPSSQEAQVEVVVQRTSDFNVVIWDQTLTLQSQAYGRYEQVSG